MADFDLEATDQELVGFFSAFDDVVASDELKSATLSAIFMETDPADATADASQTSVSASTLTLVPDDDMDASIGDEISDPTLSAVGENEETVADGFKAIEGDRVVDAGMSLRHANAVKGMKVVTGGAASSRTVRHPLRMRIAAAIVAIALVGAAGGVAYAVPSNYVQVTEGGVTVDLGVNVFGVTVAADATTDEGKAVLADLDLRDRGFEDALASVIDRMAARGEGDGSVGVQVSGTFGLDRLDRGANRVIRDRGFERGGGARGAGAPPDANASSGVGDSGGDGAGGVAETTNGADNARGVSGQPAPTGGGRGDAMPTASGRSGSGRAMDADGVTVDVGDATKTMDVRDVADPPSSTSTSDRPDASPGAVGTDRDFETSADAYGRRRQPGVGISAQDDQSLFADRNIVDNQTNVSFGQTDDIAQPQPTRPIVERGNRARGWEDRDV